MYDTYWESVFQQWSQGPGATEAARTDNAARVITDCLRDAGILNKYQIEVFAQGSYANRTNIPQESDVDIAARCMTSFFGQYPPNITAADYGFSDSPFTFMDFKDDVGKALIARFGGDVQRRNKCFAIHSNTYRVDTDVTPSLEHRRFVSETEVYHGCEFISDAGRRIINWPKQHIHYGIAKNARTNRRFKRHVRILKRLQFDLIENGRIKDKLVPSYAIECAVYNVPDSEFLQESYYKSVRRMLADIYESTTTDEKCSEWAEVNELKWMFRPGQPWNREDVNDLMVKCWNHIGYK